MTKIQLPGVIDVHVHLREPGATQKEDFSSGTRAAIAGGVTVVLDMPNNPEPIVNPALLEQKITLAKNRTFCDIGFHFAAHPKSIPHMEEVVAKVFGYKLYMNPTTGNLLVSAKDAEKVFEAIPKDKIVITHSEGDTLQSAIHLAKKYNKRLHVAHVSLVSEVILIRKAKAEGMDISCEITPHHLFLNNEDAMRLGAFGMMKPPLNAQENQIACWEALRDGTIDMIATDHAPHTKEEKEQAEKPPFGVPGVETLLPLMLTAMQEGKITLELLKRITHDNPQRIFSIPEQKDTYVEVDLDKEYTLSNDKIFTKAGWTPFTDMKMTGKITAVYLRGEKVFDGEKVAPEPFGKFITPSL